MAVGGRGGGELCLCMVVGLGSFFFFLGCGFCVIMGGSRVRLIPCC